MIASTHITTADELWKLPDDGLHHELINGELLTMSPPGGKHGAVTMRLFHILTRHIAEKNLGFAFAAETGFKLDHDPDTVLAPDFAFVSRDRITVLPDGYIDIAPDLVVEVLSPNQSNKEMRQKAELWINVGAKLVWLVHPQRQTFQVFMKNIEPKLLTVNEELTGGAVIVDSPASL